MPAPHSLQLEAPKYENQQDILRYEALNFYFLHRLHEIGLRVKGSTSLPLFGENVPALHAVQLSRYPVHSLYNDPTVKGTNCLENLKHSL